MHARDLVSVVHYSWASQRCSNSARSQTSSSSARNSREAAQRAKKAYYPRAPAKLSGHNTLRSAKKASKLSTHDTMPRRAILIVASASALLAPQTRVTQTRRHSTTLNPLEQLAEQAQIKAYEASAAAIAATISAKVAEKGDRMPDGMVPIVQEFMRTYLDVVAKQKRDPMEKVPTRRPVYVIDATRVQE